MSSAQSWAWTITAGIILPEALVGDTRRANGPSGGGVETLELELRVFSFSDVRRVGTIVKIATRKILGLI